MRKLFDIDSKDYNIEGKGLVRPSARSIIINKGKIAMVYSQKYNYYKFPGGGIEECEDRLDALKRETLEEAGLLIISDSIREFGYVHRIQKALFGGFDYFLQDNYYYICQVEEKGVDQNLDDYEADEKFTLVYIDPRLAIEANMDINHGPKDRNMIVREAMVLEVLIREGYFR